MLSVPHLIIIFVVALVVFGPEKLPELARNLGKVMGEFKRATGDLRSTLEGHLRDLEHEAEQHKIGGTPPAQPPVPSPPEGSAVTGTVSTIPIHVLIGHTSDQEASVAPEPSPPPGSAADPDAPGEANREVLTPTQPALEHHPETLTDGDVRSA